MRNAERICKGVALALGLLLLTLGCEQIGTTPGVVRLLYFRQSGQSGVFLNETLVFHFDGELDRSSLTSSSLSITRTDGVPAAGRFEVRGSQVLFTPKTPLERDFLDGGLLPSHRYRVELFGFPNPDGLRGRNGEPLARTEVHFFETVNVEDESAPRFEDLSPDRSAPLQLESPELGPLDPIRLRCAEPIDPSTLFGEDFQLYFDQSLDPIALRAVLRSNGESGAVIELRPIDSKGALRALPLDRSQLWTPSDSFRLRDFGGHLTVPVWQHEARAGFLIVTEPQLGQSVGSQLMSFLDESRRSPELIEESVGTAFWSEGVVTIRYPAAAGDGSAGDVSLVGEELRKDVQATDLHVAKGERVHLKAEGLVLLRSQGRVRIDGSLRRNVEGKQIEAEESGMVDYSEWHRFADKQADWNVPEMTFEEGESLSRWLKAAEELDLPWTVIIAGGEITVRGELWLDGPLLLVSGGWIRVIGEIRTRPRQFWMLGHSLSSRKTGAPRIAPLTMDTPKLNTLAQNQTWTVMTTPFRPSSGVRRWRPARVIGDARGGSIEVRYFGERDLANNVEVVGPVDSPVLLEDCEAIRVRIDLSANQGQPTDLWNPPVLDAVEFVWDEPEADR